MAARGKILTSSCSKRCNARSIGPVVDSQNGYMHGTPISLAGCGKRVFGPLSTDAIMHYDAFYQAMNTEYWCPKLVFPQPASVFWKQVQYLNAEIARFAGEGDHTALYKYLLTVGPTSVSDRVHYFSSFYYMLITLSLYSVFAAIAEFFIPAFQIAYAVHLCGWATALFLSMAAVATQLFFMFVTGVRNRREYMEKFRFLPAAMIGGAGAFISLDFAFFTGTSTFSQTRAIWIVLLALLAFVLANLGNKQWRSIINEQIVHVRKCREDIADLVRSNEGAS